jgi:ketosteroid isomerase-like protein
MSQENVEAFKRAFDAINRQDAGALVSELDPEVEWHGAILMAMGGNQTVSGDTRPSTPETRDLGDRMVAIGRVSARGKESEAEVESPHAIVVEFKNGRGLRIRAYLDPKEALEAVGLRE